MTINQRRAALVLANAVRMRNAQIKREIAGMSMQDGLRHVADLIEHPEGPAGTVQVGQLVDAVRRVGPLVSRPLFARAGIYRQTRRVRDLTARQRESLARVLREKAASHRPRVAA